MSDERLLTIKELKQLITKNDTGLLFCFGTSLISRIIQAKTKLNNREVVPSHVAIIYQGKFLYESTSQPQEYKNKTIPAGVRRYLLTDFYNIEKDMTAAAISFLNFLFSQSLCCFFCLHLRDFSHYSFLFLFSQVEPGKKVRIVPVMTVVAEERNFWCM